MNMVNVPLLVYFYYPFIICNTLMFCSCPQSVKTETDTMRPLTLFNGIKFHILILYSIYIHKHIWHRFFYQSISLHIYAYIFLPINQSINMPIFLSINQSITLSMYLYIYYPSINLLIYVPINPSHYLSVSVQSINMPIFLPINQSPCLCIYISIYLSIHQSIYLCMYPSISLIIYLFVSLSHTQAHNKV